MSDLIDRQMLKADLLCGDNAEHDYCFPCRAILERIDNQPAVETHDKRTETHACDYISRQDAIEEIKAVFEWHDTVTMERMVEHFKNLPSVQPERTCVNCGRTVNNGGWYADGGTRCPIEEHYALPKDGYCHLWEKRNITDDDYPERRTDE